MVEPVGEVSGVRCQVFFRNQVSVFRPADGLKSGQSNLKINFVLGLVSYGGLTKK